MKLIQPVYINPFISKNNLFPSTVYKQKKIHVNAITGIAIVEASNTNNYAGYSILYANLKNMKL